MSREKTAGNGITGLRQKSVSKGRKAKVDSAQLQPPLSFKEMLFSMPDVGEDSDFARIQDLGRQVEL